MVKGERMEDMTEPAVSGELPLDDISADGGGQLTQVGPPYDGSGGVVRGVERWLQSDASLWSVRSAARRVGAWVAGRSRPPH